MPFQEKNLKGCLVSFKKLNLVKIIAVFVAMIFFYQQISWAEGDSKANWSKAMTRGVAENLVESNFKIPYKYAKTNEVYNDETDTQIIHIQDAHASLSAQYSIVKLLDSLLSKYDIDFIAIEGATGYVDTSFLKSFPIQKIKKDKAESLMKQGLMGAGEFFSIISNDKDIALYGIENEDLYWQNVKQFCEVAEDRDDLVKNVEVFMHQLRILEEKVCSKELLELNQSSFLHKDSKISFAEYWERISLLIKNKDIDTSKYLEINKLREAIELEKSIDFTAANIERRKLIAYLNERLNKTELEALVLNAVAFRENRISKSAFHKYLIALAEEYYVPAEEYQNLIKFSEYITIYEGLNIVLLHSELQKLENAIRVKLYRNTDESELYEKVVLAYLLKKLYTVELSDSEHEELMKYKALYNIKGFSSFIKEKCKKYDVEIINGYDIGEMLSGMEKALSFYSTAKERDHVMLSNTIKKMQLEGKKVAALITGGFHSEGLTQMMKDRKLSYLVVSPKYEASEQRPYFAVLTGKKKPYTDLLDEGKYNIAVFDFSNNQTLIGMKKDAAQMLASARFYGMDPAEISESWKKQYRVLQEITQNNPARKGIPLMTADEFDLMIDSMEVRIISSNAVVFLDGEPFLTFVKDDSEIGVKEDKISQKILSKMPEKDVSSQDIEYTDSFSDSDLFDIESIISEYRDPEYLSNIIERLPERAKRRGVKASYILKILKRDRMLPQNWTENERLVKEVRILSDKVRQSFKYSGGQLKVKVPEKEMKSEKKPDRAKKEVLGGAQTAKRRTEQQRKKTIFDLFRIRITSAVWGGIALVGLMVSFLTIGFSPSIKQPNGEYIVRNSGSAIVRGVFGVSRWGELVEEISARNILSFFSVRQVAAGTSDVYGTKTVSSDAPWKMQTHESTMAVRDVSYDASFNGTIVDLDISMSKPGRSQGEVFLEPLYSNIPGLNRGYLDLYNKTVTIEVLVAPELAGTKVQFFAKEDKRWESEYGPEITLKRGKNYISHTFKRQLTLETRMVGLKFYGSPVKGKIAVGNISISASGAGRIKPEPALPSTFDDDRKKLESVPLFSSGGVDLKLKRDGFYWHGKKKVIAGANWRVMDKYGYAFGHEGVKPWFNKPVGIKANEFAVEKKFIAIKDLGVKKVRVWLLGDGRAVLDREGHVIGYDRVFKEDVKTFLDLAQKYGIAVEFTLLDYLVAGKAKFVNGVWVQGRRKLFTDKKIRKEFIEKFVIPLVEDFGSHPAFKVIDLGNELEWLVDPSEGGGWDTINNPEVKDEPVPLNDIVAYFSETSAAIKKHSPDMMITGGFNSVSYPGLYKYLNGKVDYIAGHWYPKFGDVRPLLNGAKRISDKLKYPIALEEFPSVSFELDKMLEITAKEGYIGADFWNLTPSIDDQTSSASRLYQQMKTLREFIKSKSTLYSVAPVFLLFSSTFRSAFSKVIAPVSKFSIGFGDILGMLKENFMGTELGKGAEYFVSFIHYSTAAKVSLLIFLGTIVYFVWLIAKVNRLEVVDQEANRAFMKDIFKVIFLVVALMTSMLISIISYDNFVSLKEKKAVQEIIQKEKEQEFKNIEKDTDDNLGMVSHQRKVKHVLSSIADKKNVRMLGIAALFVLLPALARGSDVAVLGSSATESIFSSISLSQVAFFLSVMVTGFFVYTAWRNHSKLKHARAKAKLSVVDQNIKPAGSKDVVSAERWRTGSIIGAIAMMVVTVALGDSAPEKGMIDVFVEMNWFWNSGIPQTFMLVALIGSILWIKQRIQGLMKLRATRHIKDVTPDRKVKLKVLEKKTRPEKIQTVLGLPLSVYNYLGADIIAVMPKEIGVDFIVPVDETQKNYLNEFNREKGKVIGVFLDTEVLNDYITYKESKLSEKVKSIKKQKQKSLDILAIDIDSMKKDMFLMVSKAMKDIIKVMDPEKASLGFDDVKKQLKRVESENEIMKLVAFYSRLLPDIESVDLLEKSAYDLHFDRVNNDALNNVSLSGKATKLLSDIYDNDKIKYISISANSAADLRFLASGIKKMGLTKKAAQKFIHVRITDGNINENNLERVLTETGLSSYISISKNNNGGISSPNISLVKDKMKLNEILDLVEESFGIEIDHKNIAIGSSRNIVITNEDEEIIRSKDAPVFVEMQGQGLTSQMLWILVEILSHREALDGISAALGSVKLMAGYGNWYIYFPNIKVIDLEELRKEIENYEKILTAA